MSELPVLAINGPTAAGKTAVAVAVAARLGTAEIVNADSMLVYRGMDIGTAKPSLAERGGIRHHLIDIMDVTGDASVAEFQRLARESIADCRARGVLPILVGGSALYVRAILDVFEFPATDPHVREKWEQRLAEVGSEALHAELANIDAQAAAGILPGNGRRIVRALEVIELTGSFRSVIPPGQYALDNVIQVGLGLGRPELDERIATRVDRMWEQCFVAEVQQLLTQGLRQGRTASRAIGYRQIISYLDGNCTEAEAKETTVVRTRQFARKQLGWFKRDERIKWFAAGTQAIEQIVALTR